MDPHRVIRLILLQCYSFLNADSFRQYVNLNTKTIFENELDFDYDFEDIFEIDEDNIIKSGSIAQVYKAKIKKNIFNANFTNVAIKVTHPEIDIQMNFVYPFVVLYDYLFIKGYFINTLFNLIDIKSILHSIYAQYFK